MSGVTAASSRLKRIFTSSGTFTATHSGVHWVTVTGGGGGGGNGGTGSGYAGGGGGTGAQSFVDVPIYLAAGDTVTVVVGAGGTPNTSGGFSEFAGIVVAKGGGPGLNGGLSSGEVTTPTADNLPYERLGAEGGKGENNGADGLAGRWHVTKLVPTGATSSAGGSGSEGNGGGGGWSNHGKGGDGGSYETAGSAGVNPGSGGGGGGSTIAGTPGDGGAGADGIVIVEWEA